MPDFREGLPAAFALALAVGLGTHQRSASILPANVPNLMMTGAAERAYGVQFNDTGRYPRRCTRRASPWRPLKGILIVICLSACFRAFALR